MSKEKLTEGQKLRNAYKKAVETREKFINNNEEQNMNEPRPTSVDLAKAVEDFLLHELDVVTESDWFDEVIEKKVTEVLNKKLTELGKD